MRGKGGGGLWGVGSGGGAGKCSYQSFREGWLNSPDFEKEQQAKRPRVLNEMPGLNENSMLFIKPGVFSCFQCKLFQILVYGCLSKKHDLSFQKMYWYWYWYNVHC